MTAHSRGRRRESWPGVQKSVLDTARLAAGQHTLSATVADRYGQSAEGQITFTVQ